MDDRVLAKGRGPAQFSGRKRLASPAMTGNRTRRLSLREGSGQLSADLSGREVSRLDGTSIALSVNAIVKINQV